MHSVIPLMRQAHDGIELSRGEVRFSFLSLYAYGTSVCVCAYAVLGKPRVLGHVPGSLRVFSGR